MFFKRKRKRTQRKNHNFLNVFFSPKFINIQAGQSQLLQLLLDAQLVGMSTLLLAAVGGTRREAGIALAADLLVAVVLTSKHSKRGLNHTTTKTEDEVKSAFLLDVVIRESATVFQLLSSENQTLLVRRDSLLVLNLLFDSLDRVRGLDLKCDGLTSQGLDEDLHLLKPNKQHKKREKKYHKEEKNENTGK